MFNLLITCNLDKASMAFEGQDEFYIAKLLIETGVEVPVGSPILISVEDEASISAFADYKVTAAPATPAPAAAAPEPVKIAPKIEAPKPTPPPAPTKPAEPVKKPTPAPIVAAPVVVAAPVAAPASTGAPSLDGFYSVRRKETPLVTSPLAYKLKQDQDLYSIKYGRAVPAPAHAEHKKSK